MFQENPVREWRSRVRKGRRSDKGAMPGKILGKAALVHAGVREQWRLNSRRLFISFHPVLGGAQSQALPAPEGQSSDKEPQVRAVLAREPTGRLSVQKQSKIQGSQAVQRHLLTAGSWKLLTSGVGEAKSYTAVRGNRLASVHTAKEHSNLKPPTQIAHKYTENKHPKAATQ